MKKFILIGVFGTLTTIGSLVSLANMNVINLLLSDTDYGSGSSEMFNNKEEVDENGDPVYLSGEPLSDGTLESLQSGLLGGNSSNSNTGGAGSLNLLWLLQNAGEVNKESYAYQLLNVYSKLQNGEYNNLAMHLSPEAIAGSHKNETTLASYVAPTITGYGKATSGILGKTINGKKITLENAMKADIVGNVTNTSKGVWYDSNSDGCTDGPFQTIQCHPLKNVDSYANKNRTDKKYDFYNFVDAMNIKDAKYNSIAKTYAEAGSTPDPRAILMLNAIVHNRGPSGAGWMMYGLPYDLKGSVGTRIKRATLESMKPEDLEIAGGFAKDLIKWFDSSNIPLELLEGDNRKGQGLGLVLVLANGGFLDIPLQSTAKSNVIGLGNEVIGKLFPGQTTATIANHINNNYVKKPWDVLGISKSQYDSIYGSGPYANYEEPYSTRYGYLRNTVFYIDKNVKSSNYTTGENTVVRAVEGIALGYMVDVGLKGTYTLLKIAIEAGISTLTDGTVVDASNPQTVYKQKQESNSGTYNPAGAADGNFGKFLDSLGLTGTLTESQQAQIQELYNVSGGPYSQPRRGSTTKDQHYYTDCSSYASVGLYMGFGTPVSKYFETTATINGGVWLKGKGKTNSVNGKTYDAKVVQLDKNGKPMAPSTVVNKSHMRKDSAWLPYLQAGDMVNGRGGNGGHIFTYLGKNNTDKTMVLSQDISKVGPQFSKYKPGEHFTMQSAAYANVFDSGKMGLMPLMSDTSGAPYHAMRPVYNIR